MLINFLGGENAADSKLKEIGTNNPALFANYKIDAPIPNAQGKLEYPFTLSAGINNINIAQQMKREAGLLGSQSKAAA